MWRQNVRGLVPELVARLLDHIQAQLQGLSRTVEELQRRQGGSVDMRVVKAGLQAGGSTPLNVEGLLGHLAQPQTGGAPMLSANPSFFDPIAQDGALFVLSGSPNSLYRVNKSSEPPTFDPIGGSGSVTSVALTVPSILSVTGSPITGAGTLALSLATQTANRVFSGPTTGGAATPTFRALVTADLPLDSLKSTMAKTTAAAPYTNDGYIVLTDQSGNSVKVMTTA